MRAYVFIDTKPGKAKAVAKAVQALAGSSARVLTVDTLTGPHDIVVLVEGKDSDAIGRATAEDIHRVNGVEKTMICLVLPGT